GAHHGRRPGEVVHLIEDPKNNSVASIAFLDVATGAETDAADVFAGDAALVGTDLFYTTMLEKSELRRVRDGHDAVFAIPPAGHRFGLLAASPAGDRIAALGGRAAGGGAPG